MSLLAKARHLIRGESAEQHACEFLKARKLRLIEKNFRCKFGEIDIIMLDKQSLVFVEVRYRKNSAFGSGAETVTLQKQKKLVKTAQYYLQRHPETAQYACRFDVISMSAADYSNKTEIDWIKDAFQA